MGKGVSYFNGLVAYTEYIVDDAQRYSQENRYENITFRNQKSANNGKTRDETMKLSELTRYIEDNARDDCPLVFYSAADPAFTTDGWEYIDGNVGDYRAPFIGYITLSFRCSQSGVSLYKYDLLEWLYSVRDDYGNQKVTIRLHQGEGGTSRELLDDNLWGILSTSAGQYFSVGSAPNGPGFQDYMEKSYQEWGVPSF